MTCKTDRIDARGLAELSWRPLVPEIWLPTRPSGANANWRAYDGISCAIAPRSRTGLHATLVAFGHPCPVSDLFGHAGRELLDRLQMPSRGGAPSTSVSA